jgi:hypothetical protein
MAQPESHAVTEARDAMERTPAQALREGALQEVAETLLNIEQAIRRAYRAERAVSVAVDDPNLEMALRNAMEQLQSARRELMQTTFPIKSWPPSRLLINVLPSGSLVLAVDPRGRRGAAPSSCA